MKLVVGGAHQGKKEAACRMFGYQQSDFADGKTCALSDIYSCRAIFNFQEYVRRCMSAEERTDDLADVLQKENPDILIISDEIGYGVVPIDAGLRAWREQTGRICCRLADVSDTVVRVVAGIPTVIKEA